MWLPACATMPTPSEQCHVHWSEAWVQMGGSPANREELLALAAPGSHGKTVHDQLRAANSLKEVWFSRGPEDLLLCRYREVRNTCSNHVETAEFQMTQQGWSTSGALVTVCIPRDRR